MGLSIAIPVYEPDQRFLAMLLDSAVAQSDDVVVSDDASRASIVLPSRHRDRVHLIRQEQNLGMVANWNAAVRATRREVVAVVGQDDILAPGYAAAHLAALAARPDATISACGRRLIDIRGRPFASKSPFERARVHGSEGIRYFAHGDLLRWTLKWGNVYGELSALAFRRRAFEAAGGFDPAFRHAADVDLALRLAQRGVAAYTAEPLLLRRRHPLSLSVKNEREGIVAHDRLLLYERHAAGRLTPRDDADARAAIVARSLYGWGRAAVRREPASVAANRRVVSRLWRARPSSYVRFVRDALGGARSARP